MTSPHADLHGVEQPPQSSALTLTQTKMALFVHRPSQRWVVLDPDGNFWILPSHENPWNQRQPFYPTQESELEPVPGHYKHLLGLPFR
jgi:hypothetical protein